MAQHNMTPGDLKNLVALYNKRFVENGGRLAGYACPHCSTWHSTPMPSGKEQCGSKGYWDSTVKCPDCCGLSFIKIYPDGLVETVPYEMNEILNT